MTDLIFFPGFRLNKEENQTTEKVPKGVKVIYGKYISNYVNIPLEKI